MTAPHRTYVVAEVAATHGLDLDRALAAVAIVRDVGADAVKFQWVSSPERLALRRDAPEYLEHYRRLAFPRAWHGRLAVEARRRGVDYMCTTYLPEDVHVVADYVARFKVSAFEATDAPFVALHGLWDLPLVISCSMGGREAVRRSVVAWARMREARQLDAGTSLRPIGLPVDVLYCVSAYPCPDAELNLASILETWQQADPGPKYAGLSDHTRGDLTGALAVAAGARVVEFHLVPPGTDPADPDALVGRDVADAIRYVHLVREAEKLMGSEDHRAKPSEAPMLRHRVGVAR